MTEKIDLIREILARCKRKNERLSLPLIMSYNRAASRQWSELIMIDNISGGGLKFHNVKPLKPNTKINVKIDLPNKLKPVVIKGNVIWCEKNDMAKDPKKRFHIGVEFLKINDQDRRKFVSYLCEEILFQYLTKEGKVKPKWI